MKARSILIVTLAIVTLLSCVSSQTRRRKRIKDIRGTIKGNITGNTYNPDLSKVIPGSSTLAFVFDVTGSMWDDLKQVTAGARQILETTRGRVEKPLHNYVLIPFHDPVVGPTIVTSNPRTFTRALRNLYVQGGGDCPEMSVTAIREALLISLPGSFIYVFTDARSKDFYQLPEILQIIQRKQSQVVFVLTGDCEDQNHKGYKAYERIAATSSGQVFLITKDDVSEVVKFIEVSVQAHKVVLLAADHSRGGQHDWTIPFDPELQEVTISVSGPNRMLTLIDPDGITMTEGNGLEVLLNLENVFIANIKEPKPGTWRLNARSSGEHSLRVTGLSTLDFQARFSRKPTFNWTETEFQPVSGIPSYILINATGLEQPGRFRTLRLLDFSGRTIRTVSLSRPRDPNQPYLYTVEPMVMPRRPFYMAVYGLTMDDYHFVRATKNAIINIQPVAPVVVVPETHPGYFDYPAEIPCHVTSLIPYHVKWGKEIEGEWVDIGSPRFYRDSITDYYRIEEVAEASEGRYKCIANNSLGSDFGITFLDVEERPPIIITNGNVTVTPGGEIVLTCEVTSNVPYTITWSRVDGENLDRLRTRKLSNGSLLIQRALPSDEGQYQCNVVNIGGESNDVIGVIVQRPPSVTITPAGRSSFSLGGTIHIECTATGLPPPSVEWLKGTVYLLDIGKIRIARDGSYLEVVNAAQDDEGVYTCQASNKAGTDTASVQWVFTETPVVSIPEPELLILEATSVTMRCMANGIPPPTISWRKSGVDLVTGRKYEVDIDGALTIRRASRSDTGVFTCWARNGAGEDQGSVNLQVGWAPTFVVTPQNIGVELENNATMFCEADGFPLPKIKWSRGGTKKRNNNVNLLDDKRIKPQTNSLFISELTLDDDGLYTCIATNVFRTVTSSAQLGVTGTALPRVDVGELLQHVIINQSIVIPCVIVSGNPRPTREWTRRGSPFAPRGRVSISNAGSIVINDARRTDAGPYVCTATNAIGDDRRRVDLAVWVPPSITPGQTRHHTIERTSVTLPCVTSGNPPPEVVWMREGLTASLSNRIGFQMSEDGSLTILSPTEHDKGTYTCVASNPAGSDSINIDLDVYLRPRLGDDTPERYTVIVGDSITIECHVTISVPPPAYSWAKDGEPLTGNDVGVVMTSDGRITVSSAKISDAGRYTCTASNVAGSVRRDMMLKVLLPPQIWKGPSLIKILVNEDATLTCHATGLPTPVIKWRRGDVEIGEDFHPRFTVLTRPESSELHISNSKLGDDDEYICLAINSAGRDTSSVTLDVQKTPVISSSLCIPSADNNECTVTPIESESLRLTCNATGDPKPTIRWYHDEEELDDEDVNVRIDADGTLILFVVSSDDNGQYICEAENEHGIVTEITNVKIHERPEIEGSDGEIESIWVLEGEDVDLTCEADAVPPPRIIWYGGDTQEEVVEEDPDHIAFLQRGRTFRITSARISDTGLYKCIATNKVGETNKYVRLDVYVRPSIYDSDDVSTHIVILNDVVQLECRVEGIPIPEVEWFKGLSPVVADDERVEIRDHGEVLRIDRAAVTDTSSYKCIATNKVGDASKFFDLNVHVPPSIRGSDRAYTVIVHDPLTLKCIVTGIPRPSVTWLHGDVMLTSRPDIHISDNNQMIEISKIAVADEGSYSCKATNKAGEDMQTHTVTVLVPPSIIGDVLSNVTVTLGGSATLTCDAIGKPPPTIVWLKDEIPIFSGAGEEIFSPDGRQLTITNARESDSGKYICIASNNVGDANKIHNFDVLVPPVIGNPIQEVIATEHDTATLHCRVYGHPFPEIRWEVYGNSLEVSDRISLSSRDQDLTIIDVTDEDAKEYSCTAINSVGRASKKINFIVHVPAVITYPRRNRVEHTVREGRRYILRCVANGIPIPKMTWLKDGVRLVNSRYIKVRDSGRVLVMLRTDVGNHEGAYECLANNEVGEDSRKMSLIVHVPPVIYGHGKTKNKVITVGRSEMLECRIKRGKPTPQIRWYNRDNQVINASRDFVFTNNKQRLHILSTQLHDVGNYWCEATNVAGRSRKNFHLDVIVPPSVRGEDETEKINVVLDNDVTLQCHVTGIPTPRITWLKNGREISSFRGEQFIVSAGGSKLTITRAEESDAGSYQCVATNSAGNSSKNFLLDVFLPPSIGGEQIENITVVQNNPATMLCDVDAFPPPQITWFKNSRPLLLGPGINLSSNNSRLNILWAQEDDAAVYHCEAVNIAGKQNKNFRLKVHVIPTISGPSYSRIEHVVGDRIKMVCDYDGLPRPLVEWQKDARSLPNGATVRSDSRMLVIQSARVRHSGLFTCNASNVAGHAVKTYDVTILKPPSILGGDDVETVVVNRGEELTLECDVTGTPTPEIVWKKNRRKISKYFDRAYTSENGRFLTVDQSGVEDSGKYICIATNDVGVADKRFQVDVRVPPTIRDGAEVEHRWVARGNNISLSCDADAVPPPTLQWRVNGATLIQNPRVRTQSGGRILFVSSAQDGDAAMYTCVASNVVGTTSRDVQLDVYSIPSIPDGDVISRHDVNRGKPFRLECNVVGYPIPDVEWQKDGYRIASTLLGVIASSSAGFQLSESGRYLTVDSADLQHTGDYTCRAVNEAGEDSKQHKVNVRVPPTIDDDDSSPSIVTTHVNTPTLLRCSAYGIPSPTIQWLKNGHTIDVEGNTNLVVQFGGRYLRISNTAEDDNGVYTCIASNPAGKASRDFQLVVDVPPVIEGADELSPESLGVPANENVLMRCVIIEGSPFPTITWWKGRERLEKNSRIRLSSRDQFLVIERSRTLDTGRYRCTAINDAGEDVKMFDVEVQTPPVFPDGGDHAVVDVNEGSPLHIHCKIIAVPLPQLTWYKDGVPITSSNEVFIFPGGRSLQISSTKSSDAGRYTCVATNNVGRDEKVTDVAVNVPPSIGDGDNDAPEIIKESVNNSFTLSCPVSGYPQPTMKWYKNGLPLESDDIKYSIDQNGQRLIVLMVQQEDSGHYDCRAKNKAGQDSKAFIANIQIPPTISGPLFERRVATQNQAVVMLCDASGTPEPTIGWMKDGEPLSHDDHRYSVITHGRLLIILSAQTTDNGRFTCVATNAVGSARKVYEMMTHVAPVLPTSSGDITVDQGETATFSCQSNAVPVPSVEWTKNGIPIEPDELNEELIMSEGRDILTIRNSKEEDAGRYMCVVSNDAGIQSKNFKLSVHVPPTIAGPSSVDVTSVRGSPITLFCDVYAVPKATVTWMKDGVLLRSNADMQILTGGTRLQIGSSDVDDTGSYVCHADNTIGEATKSFHLRVQVPTGVIVPEPEVEVVLGEDESLRCVVTGTPKPDVTWYKNGEAIKEHNHPNLAVSDNGETLHLYRAQLSDGAEYVCEATNEAGGDRGSINLHILVPPRLGDADGEPDHIDVIAGNHVLMECNVTGGIPPPSITWLRNGIPLEVSDRIQLVSAGRILKILHAQETDTASYSCLATNEAGSVSHDFVLDVYVSPTFRSNKDENLIVYAGESVTLDCTALGVPQPEVAWTKDQIPLRGLFPREGSRTRAVADGQQVTITKAEVGDTGRYTCLALSIAGRRKKHIDLQVYERTRILRSDEIERIVVKVGDSVDLICDASATPLPVVSWVKNEEEPVIDSSRVLDNGRKMHIFSAQLSDTGTYTCLASSPAGVAEKDYYVTVNLPPTINDRGNDVTAVVGDNVTLECKSDAYPPPTLSWLKNGHPLNEHGRFLLLFDVQTFDSADYTCTATNVAGTTSQVTHLSVFEPPTIDEGSTSITAIQGDTVLLPCVARGTPTPKVKWRKGSEQLAKDLPRHIFREEGSLLVVNVDVEDGGRYVCLASNGAGSERRIIELLVQVPPTISQGETNVTVIVNNPVTLDCEAEGIPPPEVTWTKDGLKLPTKSDPLYSILGAGSLRVASAAVSDAGLYRCLVSSAAGRAYRDISLFVQVPPGISTGPSKITRNPGASLRIACDVSGIPRPQVHWMRNGQRINNKRGSDMFVDLNNGLVIPSVRIQDDAIYVCTATNTAGTARYEVELEVHSHPEISSISDDMTVFEGDSISLPCDVLGTPRPMVSWRKGTELITRQSERMRVMEDNSLMIVAAQVGDVGKYTCVAQNPAGVATNDVMLDVYTAPVFENDFPTTKTVIAGELLVLPISVSAHPEPEVTWMRNGKKIESDDNSLQIPVISLQDEGLYSVTASNPAGTISRYMSLVVHASPTIETAGHPDVTVNKGEQIALTVTVSGKPWPEVTWTKDGREVTESNFRFRLSDSGSLTIDNARSSDSGRYIATAINAAGRSSVDFDVTVRIPPTITESPRDVELSSGDRLELVCAASGIPTPTISWIFKKQPVPERPIESPGESRFVIEHVRPQDAGSYVCEARNPAGVRMAAGFLTVRSPPKFRDELNLDQVDDLGGNSMLDCYVDADPRPTITWTKDGQPIADMNRVRQFSNGSLMIYNTELIDAGNYRCTAFNDAGSVQRTLKLTLEMTPEITLSPSDKIIDAGNAVLLSCAARGQPTPVIEWRKESRPLSFGDRTSILSNNSLRIVASRLGDTGEYECIATNYKGSDISAALVTIRVHGGYSEWGDYGACSTTCGAGVRHRQRFCTNPTPANGGRGCQGPSRDEQGCQQGTCPVDGGWGLWTFWEKCSVTCGQGVRSRSRECNHPQPQHGGAPCNGKDTEQLVCVGLRCAVNGGWSNWGPWLPCSASCGHAIQKRIRHCNNPLPSGGGARCFGAETSSRLCNADPCPEDGNWSSWGLWEVCSASCGGGSRSRLRECSDPPPTSGGRPCSGSNTQTENCHTEACSVNGNWAGWGVWSSCSRSCGGGQANRYRSCTNPPPRFGGRFCYGTDSEQRVCGLQSCPVDGHWSAWGEWSECSRTCGFGDRVRTRLCNNPRPSSSGRWCAGDATRSDRCRMRFCRGGPRQGEGIVFGSVNDIPFGGSDISANGTDIGDDKTRIIAKISNIPQTVGPYLKTQVSLLSPIYWTMAREVEGAYNGYTLTEGVFDRSVMVEFANGDIVKMTHKAKGLDADGKLRMNVVMEGDVPETEPDTAVEIKDYTEDYVQTGAGNLFAFSDRLISIGGYIMPYTWNHSITYNSSRGRMPFLVEQLSASDVLVTYDPKAEELTFQADVRIGRGDPSDRCPNGFLLDRSGMYCLDENECDSQQPCSHSCINVMGSFICGCPAGFAIGSDGRQCEDIDECVTDLYTCPPTLECFNTLGGYKCVITCGPGFKRSDNGRTCEDINECELPGERVCNHVCHNTLGSYRCECRHGYRKARRGKCVDINECYRRACRDDQRCENTDGGYRCIDDCPTGMEKTRYGVCVDINECTTDRHECGPGMICRNTEGGYNCACPLGFKATNKNPPCVDINECVDYARSPCPYQCINNIGSFDCICPPGLLYLADRKSCVGLVRHPHRRPAIDLRKTPTQSFRFRLRHRSRTRRNAGFEVDVVQRRNCHPGLHIIDGTCKDLNECTDVPGICQHSCNNTFGSYECVCPEGYRVAANKRNCEDINECKEGLLRCLPNQMCFNQLGSVSCINTPCPVGYIRASTSGYCVKQCFGPNCANKPRYGIEYKTVALPFGIGANQDLVRLAVYTNDDRLHLKTRFRTRYLFGSPFGIRNENYKGVVFTTERLDTARTYQLQAEATSLDIDDHVEYQTTFIIHISVAAHRF